MPLFQRAGTERVHLRILRGAGIQGTAADLAKRENPVGSAGRGLDIGAGCALHQPKGTCGRRDVGPECGAGLRLAVGAMADRDGAWLDFRFVLNRAAMALTLNFQLHLPGAALAVIAASGRW